MPTQAIVYARFSPRPNAGECESVEHQLEQAALYAIEHDLEIVGEYHDKDTSGSVRWQDRQGLFDALNDLKRDQVLLVRALDRLSRDPMDSIFIERMVSKKGARIVSMQGEGTDDTGPTGKLIRRILQAFGEFQREITNARTRAAMLRNQREGKRMSCRLPYGWMEDPDSEEHKSGKGKVGMIPDEMEQKNIEKMIALHKEGYGLRAICREMSDLGLPTRMGGIWHATTVKGILKRENQL